ncbi:MAG TPA: RHS repeat-associated core domain-containing protein [Opitutaceae bacterium]|nr:RHS repeat-associated core domain-containing protein [Opitutaceae bacterium]
MRSFLLLLAALAGVVPAFAQKSPKENAQIWLGLNTSIYAAADYSLHLESTFPGESDPLSSTTYTNEVNLSTAVSPGDLRTHIYPGREYLLHVYSSNWTTADLHFDVPAGYTLNLGYEDQGRTPASSFLASSSTMGLTYTVSIEVDPDDGSGQLALGYARSPRIDDVTWSISLGSTNDGRSAGVLRWRDTTVSSDLLNSLSLVYVDPVSDEVLVERESNGAVKYISTPKGQLRIFRNSDPTTGYEVSIYTPLDVPGSGRDFTGYTPYITYTISAASGGGVQITRHQDADETWVLTSTTLTSTTGSRVTEYTSTANTPVTGERQEDLKVYYSGDSAHPATFLRRIYKTFSWGEELLSETSDPSGAALTTTYDYYSSGWASSGSSLSGNAGKLASVVHPDGSWEKYDYYDTEARWGQLNHIYRPWQSSPSSPSSASTSNCALTTLLYQARRSLYEEIPSGTQTYVNGTQVGGSSGTYSFGTQSDYDDSPYNTPIRTDTIVTSTSGSASLTTVRKVFDAGVIPYTGGTVGSSHLSSAVVANPALAGRLYSETRPDGTRTSAAYEIGHWVSYFVASTSMWDSYSFSPHVVDAWWAEVYINGNSTAVDGSDSTPLSSITWDTAEMSGSVTHAIEPVYLTPNRSLRKDVYRSIDGTYLQEVTYVYAGSGNFKMISWKTTTFDQGLWVVCEDSTGSKSVRTYSNGRVTSETAGDGTKMEYTLDDLFRVENARRTGVSATSGYAAQGNVDTAYTYDAADHVLTTTTTGGSLSLGASATYDLVGRVTSQTDTTGLTTNYEYAFDGTNGGSIVTTKLPGHTTMNPRDQVVATWRDGSAKSVTGAAVVNQYAERTLSSGSGESGFLVTTTYTLRSSDLSSPTSAPRWQSAVTDWAGRPVRNEAPAYSSGTFTKSYAYYSTGQLKKTTETGLAPTYYQYDGQGALKYTWLDVDNDTNDASPSPELSGPDRVTSVLNDFYDAGSGLWYQRSRSYVYNQASSSTALLLSEQRTQLVPYPGSGTDFDNRKVRTEQHSFDVSGNETVRTLLADPSTRISTVTTNLPDSSTDDLVTAFNGLTVAHRTAQNLTTTFGYDDLMRPVAQTDPRLGTATTAYYTSGTGALGQVSSVTDAASNATSYDYDSTTGRLASTTNALGKIAYCSYNVRGQVTRMWGDTTYPVEYAFDDYGQQTTMSTFRGGSGWTASTWPSSPGTADTTTWDYENATGLLLSKTDAQSHEVDYTYTARGQLATRTWARGTVATYSYDSSTAEQTGISYSDSTPAITYTYNRMGQTATVADVAGTRTFDYSTSTTSLNSETFPSYFEARVLSRKYDSTTTGAHGRNTGFTLSGASGSGTDNDVSYTYDSTGRFSGLSTPSSGPAFTYAFTSGSNLVASIAETSGWTETNTYETHRNLLTEIKGQFGSPVKAQFDYAHDALGRRETVVDTGEIFARYDSSAITTHYGYNDRSEVTSAQSYYGTSTTDTTYPMAGRGWAYAYDNIGSRTSSTVIGTSSGDTHTTTYTNNNLNQVTARAGPGSLEVSGLAPTSATVTVNSASVTRQGEYYYKNVTGSASTWTSCAVTSSAGGSDTRYGFLPPSSETHTYDDDGNVTSDGRWNYTWDAENRLISMTTVSAAYGVGVPRQFIQFSYDYLGRRVRKTVANWDSGSSTYVAATDRKFIYNGWNLIGEYDVASPLSLVNAYLWGLDLSGNLVDGGGVGGLLAIKQVSGSVWHLPYYDGNGNVTTLVNRATGAVTAAYEYSPFGETLRANGSYAATNSFRYSTKYADSETQLLYYGFRYYEPSLGRWLGRDPLEEKGGLHLYAFVRNNPVNSWDVLGQHNGNDQEWAEEVNRYCLDPGEADTSSWTNDDWNWANTCYDNYAQAAWQEQYLGFQAQFEDHNQKAEANMAEGLAQYNQMVAASQPNSTEGEDVEGEVDNSPATSKAGTNSATGGTTTDDSTIAGNGVTATSESNNLPPDVSPESLTFTGSIAPVSVYINGPPSPESTATATPTSEIGYGQSITVGGSGAPVDSFPYTNTTSTDCGIAAIRNVETLETGNPARSRADIIALLGEPTGTFEDGGAGMTRVRTNLNSALNPIGFTATKAQVSSQEGFVGLVGQGNVMVVGTTVNGRDHVVVVAPVAPGFTTVNVYNYGPTTTTGHADVQTMPAAEAAKIPTQTKSGASGNIWVVTRTSPPTPTGL